MKPFIADYGLGHFFKQYNVERGQLMRLGGLILPQKGIIFSNIYDILHDINIGIFCGKEDILV